MTAPVPELFAALVARESGVAPGLVPRLPTLFEDVPAADDPEPAGTGSVAPTQAAGPQAAAPPAEPPAAPAAAPPGAEAPAVRRRHEVVRVEERVRVETRETEPSESRPRPVRSLEPEPPARPREPGPRRLTEPEPVRRPAPPGDQVAVLRPSAVVPAAATPEPDAPGRRDPATVQVSVNRHEPNGGTHPVLREPPTTTEVAEPVVHVSIGRVEVRAVPEQAAPRARRTERRTQTLDDYLEQRNQGSRA